MKTKKNIFDYDEICRVTQFAVRKYHIKRPKGMSLEEFCHEVAVFMFFRCNLEKPGAGAIIKNARWASAKLFRLKPNGDKDFAKTESVLGSLENTDTTDLIGEILDLPLQEKDREILESLANGLDNAEIYTKLSLSRQNYHLRKKVLFAKIRLLIVDESNN